MSTWQVVRNLVEQQLAMRYRRAWLGLAWMLLVPLATMAVMGIALSLVFEIRTVELICHILVSMLPFALYQNAVAQASHALVAHQDILRRHNVNRIAFPLSAVALCIVEYLIASLSLVVLGPWLGIRVSAAWVMLPVGFAAICMFATGLGLLGAIGTVYFRDLGHLIQVGLTLMYWVTPVVYQPERIPAVAQPYFLLNPMYSMLALYTEPLIHGRYPPTLQTGIALATAAVLLSGGWWVFRRHARRVVFYL